MRSQLKTRAAALLAGALAASCVSAAENVLTQMSDALADIMEKVMPSVVVVQTETTRVPVYYDFLFRPIPGRPERLMGQGSGVVIDTEGHVLTSAHVIQNADFIKVILHDGTEFDAELVGEDAHTDIAVVRIKNKGDTVLTPIAQGDSDALRVGEIAIAVGSPFSLSGSVTMGVVSQKGRTVGLLPYEDFIQTDATINPGNSGGPLVDTRGRMVGLNAVIQTAGPQGSIGIGFAVPGNRAFTIAQTLINGEAIKRPWLGILPRDMTPAEARYFLGTPGGVYVAEVFRGTPAYRGGLYRGDIVLEVNEKPVASVLELQREVFRSEIGDPVTLTVIRSNRKIKIKVTTEMMPNARTFE